MDIKKIILEKLNKNGEVKISDITEKTGFSRAYINRFFKELKEGEKIILIGKANRAHYVLPDKNKILKARKKILNGHYIFKEYAGETFKFSKTEVIIKLYKTDTNYISRSQARRILSGLEKFKTIILDFRDIDTVGQAFADEVFRVWQNRHPDIKIQYQNSNENIVFMIKRAGAKVG